MNKVILTGRFVADPEMSYFPDGDAITKFRFAVNSGYGEYERADFFNVEITGKKAENVNQYLSKGSKALVEGRMVCDQVEDKYYWKVKAFNVEFLDSKKEEKEQEELAF